MNMKKWFLKRTLSALSILPISSVALAAESRLTETEGNVSSHVTLAKMDLQNPIILQARRAIFKVMQSKVTVADATTRFRSLHPELSGAEIDLEFQSALRLLAEKGMITINEKEIVSHIPSGLGGL